MKLTVWENFFFNSVLSFSLPERATFKDSPYLKLLLRIKNVEGFLS